MLPNKCVKILGHGHNGDGDMRECGCNFFVGIISTLLKCETHPSLCFPNCSADSAALVANDHLPQITRCPEVYWITPKRCVCETIH